MSIIFQILHCPVIAAVLLFSGPTAFGQEELASPEVERIQLPVSQIDVENAIGTGGDTLEGAWLQALSVDPGLEASRWQASAAQRGFCAAKAEKLPMLSATSSYNVFDNSLTVQAPVPAVPGVLPAPVTASVTVNQREFYLGGVRVAQPLYTFGRIRHAINAAGAEVTAAVADEERTELDVKLQVAAAFVGVLQAQRLYEVAKEGVKDLTEHERVIDNQLNEGVGIRANLLAVQVARANAEQFQLQAENLLVVSKSTYNRSLQRPLEAAVLLTDLDQPTLQYDLDLAIGEAMHVRPEIGLLSAKVRALRSQASSVRAASKPQIAVEGGFSYIENRFLAQEAFNNVSVLAEWNFWDSGRKGNRACQLDHTAEALLRKRSELESVITLQVKSAWHTLTASLARVDVNRQALESADENLRVSGNRFVQGEGTNTEVLDAQTLRTAAYSNYYTSLYAAVLAEMQLRRAVGIL
ncbi:MAG: TolC family protein [Bythopirellula sp.]